MIYHGCYWGGCIVDTEYFDVHPRGYHTIVSQKKRSILFLYVWLFGMGRWLNFGKFSPSTFATMTNVEFRNSQLNSQRIYKSLAFAMRSQIRWHCFDDELNSFIRWNSVRLLIQWYNDYRMNKYIFDELDKRFAVYESDDTHRTSRFVIDLAFESYLTIRFTSNAFKKLNRNFKTWTMTQIRLFMFVDHDFTFFIICYCYYFSFKCSAALAQIRVEHDVIFDSDLSKVSNLLIEQTHLINKFSYIIAVIKEIFRFFSTIFVMRDDFFEIEFQDFNDSRYSIIKMNIWILHNVLQRHSEYWKEFDVFISNRWLVGLEDFLYSIKSAWRSFEFDFRNCVNQTLVMLNVKTMLIMTIRKFDIHFVYEKWDQIHFK